MLMSKHIQLALAATLVVLLGATAVPNMASAQKNMQLAQAGDKDRDGKSAKSSKSSKSSKSAKSAKSSKNVVVKKTTIVNRRVIQRDRVVVRTSSRPVFVVVGTPVVYAAYGSGYCRALHRGYHWAPRVGWHSGQHVGRVRC